MTDLHIALETAVSAAKQAGERIRRGYNEDVSIEVKSDPVDRVTQVDKEAQALIVDTIKASFPDHGFLGEEDLLQGDQSKRWIIDPMDGTSNFIQGLPHVGVSIGFEEDGEVQVGVLYFPVYDDLYTAVKGEGAKCNGLAIHIRDCETMADAVIAEIYSDRTHRGKEVVFPPCLAFRKFGSAITSLAYLAHGRIDGAALRCCRWDIAAAEVIVAEAGGKLSWQYDQDDGDQRGVLTCIASGEGIESEFTEFVHSVYEK